ncbi:MAG: DNA recombination protein RmuC [Acidobacteriaceae bacterium]|nr:DNA recombination protein RmuC [Acidobacteriaceae bacterium]
MMITVLIIALISAVAIAAYQFGEAKRWRKTADALREDNDRKRGELESTKLDLVHKEAEVSHAREVAQVQLGLLTQTQQQLEDRFKALACDVLQGNSQMFLDRSRDQIAQLTEPVNQTLRRFEEHVSAIERSRIGAYAELTSQVQLLTSLQERVRQSADELKQALRSPLQRGRWGEIQLRRVVELAGMLEHCDFAEQKTLFGETNQRPDLIVRLPNNCQVAVDAKVSLEGYLRAIESHSDADRIRHLGEHARQVKAHIKTLGEKAYWERLSPSPEFVVAFLPLESLFSAALEQDSTLLEFGVARRVLIATPLTLISLLLTVAHGWRQQSLTENVEKIRETGMELYARLIKLSGHFAKLGSAIERTVESYNQTVGSLEKNVLTSARRFRDLRPATAIELAEVQLIESSPRRLDGSKWPALSVSENSE